MLLKEVGLRIQELRKGRLNITQSEFAKRLGYDRTFLSRVERSVQNITLETLDKICNGLGITIKEFFNN